MSNEFLSIGMNPIVELQAQETGIDAEKISAFFAILNDEMTSVHQRVMNRCEEAGLTIEETLRLLLNMSGSIGVENANLDLIDVNTDEGE